MYASVRRLSNRRALRSNSTGDCSTFSSRAPRPSRFHGARLVNASGTGGLRFGVEGCGDGCSELLAPPLDRDDPQGEAERSAVKLLGELCDRHQPLCQLLGVRCAAGSNAWLATP